MHKLADLSKVKSVDLRTSRTRTLVPMFAAESFIRKQNENEDKSLLHVVEGEAGEAVVADFTDEKRRL